MFAARCLEVSLAFFFLVYVACSVGVCLAWEICSRAFQFRPGGHAASLLFGLRVLPFCSAVVLTAAVCVPSFWMLESRASSSRLGTNGFLLGLGCLAVLTIGLTRAAKAHRTTARAIASWLRGSSQLTFSFSILPHEAGALVTLGAVPLAMAALFTLGFTLPSYELLDSRVADEGICMAPLVLAAGCLLFMSVGIARALLARRVPTNSLMAGLPDTHSAEMVPIYQTSRSCPTLTVAGIYTPKVLVSEVALATLSEDELRSALRHELAHIEAQDNLKKLLFRFLDFPGMAKLEQAWSEAAEIAADNAAVSSLSQALDLASALIKISRITPVRTAVLATGFLHGDSGLRDRVQRLFSWSNHKPSDLESLSGMVVPPMFVVCAFLIAFYSSALVNAHGLMASLLR